MPAEENGIFSSFSACGYSQSLQKNNAYCWKAIKQQHEMRAKTEVRLTRARRADANTIEQLKCMAL